MAKVGVMSMQRIANYGSFLQAYGLNALLEGMGQETEFVDYHVGRPVMSAGTKPLTPVGRKLRKLREAMGYDATVRQRLQFVLYKKNFAARYHGELGLDREPNYLPKLDVLLIGSDEVFNCIQQNQMVGFSPELFGAGHRAEKLVSYAASFGNTTLEKLEKYGKAKEVAEALQGFDAISVRDRNSGEIVRELSGREPEYHLDPVLIYDFMGKCNRIPDLVQKEKYLILYAYSGRVSPEEAEWIRHYARAKGWKVYAIGGVHRCADRFIDCSPFEVLSYFRHAEEVITDTFHGTIFSIIARRRFVTITRRSIGDSYGNEEKLTDLLERLGLECRQVWDIHKAGDILETEIKYGETEEILQREQRKSQVYLHNITGGKH